MKTHSKLILVIVLILLASNSFLGLVNFKDSEDIATDILIEKNYDELKNICEYYFYKLINDMEYIVTTWSDSDEIVNYDKKPDSPRIVTYVPDDFKFVASKWEGLTSSIKDITWIYYALESDGSIYITPADATMPSDYDARTREWYQGTVSKKGAVYWTEPYVDAGNSGKILQTVSKAVYKDGVLKGVIGLDIELNKFTEIISDLSFSKDSLIFLVNQNGDILAHNSDDVEFYTSQFLDNLDPNISSQITEYENDKYLISWVPVDLNGWKLIAVNKTNFDDALDIIKDRILYIVLMTATLGILISFIMSKNIMKPLEEMVGITEKVKNSNFNVRFDIKTNDEFSTLALSFNQMLEHIESLIVELDDNYVHTVKLLANSIEANDKYTRGHCDRVGMIAMEIANKMQLPLDKQKALKFACILHDIGKIGIPTNILNKPSQLTDEEYELIKDHSYIGYEIIKEIDFLKISADIILQHHERIDGLGYPYQLPGDSLKIEAKILAVADVYDAMTSYRIYRKIPLTPSRIRQELLNSRGTQLDASVVDHLLELIDSVDFSI